ncbi:MAG: radical SAM protein [Halarsenatibacteraceae bacterium]
MAKAVINRWIDFSPIDGPGNRTVIFFQGCNLNCSYCHNPETIASYKDDDRIPDSMYLLTVDELIEKIKQNFSYISGITVSGGEPLLQLEFLKELFMKTKELGLTNFIDTNGTIPLGEKKDLLALTDGVMLDFKASNSDDLIEITGADRLEIIKENIVFLNDLELLYEIRTVITGGLIVSQENVAEIAEFIAEIDPTINYKLIAYRNHGVRSGGDIREPSAEEMNRLKNIAEAKKCNNIQIII